MNILEIQGKTLLHYVACLKSSWTGNSSLKSSWTGNTSLIDCLVDAGADLASQDSQGLTPLMASMEAGLDKNIKILIQHCQGSPVLNAQDNRGNNVLHLAASIKETKFTKDIIKAVFFLGFSLR